MKQKKLPIIFIVVCLSVCFLLGISAFFSSGDSSTEMRDVSSVPKFINEDKTINENFDSELADYIAVRMPVRNTLLRIKAFVFEKVFASSAAQDDVIIGKNDWYYFNETTNEYLGINLLSDRAIKNIADTVEQMQEYCQDNSMQFAFTVAPNKNTLYPDNMPSRYIRSDVNNYSRLREELKNSNVNYVDFSDLNTYSQEPLYYATDSHWNVEGAIIAYNKILDSIGKPHEDYSAVERTTGEKNGDLSRMLYPDGNVTEEESVPDYAYSFAYASRLKSEEDINIRTKNKNATGSLLMFRDSFTNALLPFMAEAFGSAYFTRAIPCDMTLATDMQCDTVIYEMVQRNLENIISFAPVMPAKIQDFVFANCEDAEGKSEAFMREKSETLIHIYGTVNEEYIEDDSRIYVKLRCESGAEFIFRCFNIYEKDLYEDSICRDNGYSVYIDSTVLPSESMEVFVIIESESDTFVSQTDLYIN